MNRRLPPLNALRAFDAIARQGTMTRAAEELNVTHSAISHQIRSLEASLGVKLFERGGQRLKLTVAGNELSSTVSSALDMIAEATARAKRPAGAVNISGSLSILCMPALMSFWLMPRIGSFTSRFPHIRLNIESIANKEGLAAADISLLYGFGNWDGYWFRRLSPLYLFPVLSPTLMNHRPVRSLRDLGKHNLLHGDNGSEWRFWLAATGGLELLPGGSHHMGDARLAIEAAIHGYGVALGDTITVASLMTKGKLVAPFNLVVPAAVGFHVACRHEVRSEPVIDAFIDWLFAQLRQSSARAAPNSVGWGIKHRAP